LCIRILLNSDDFFDARRQHAVSTRSRHGRGNITYNAENASMAPDVPVVFVVDVTRDSLDEKKARFL
jgi:hypothetical protein